MAAPDSAKQTEVVSEKNSMLQKEEGETMSHGHNSTQTCDFHPRGQRHFALFLRKELCDQ
jgi:hypothetical protein